MYETERQRTRDLLLEYVIPPRPRSAGLAMVYPWENITLTQLSKQIFEIVRKYGYNGTEALFWSKFLESKGNVIVGTLETFPVPGEENNLYLDKETEILYYFKATKSIVDTDLCEKIGAAIVGTSITEDTEEIITYLYIPVKSLPIENLIIDCGSAAEYMD